jgi:CubicO group peptidase (beta-lactamase class C family)
LFYVASRTKFMTCAAMALLVDEGKIGWDTLVADALPDFKHPDPEIKKITVTDILSHRSGLELNTAYWMGEHCNLTIAPNDFVKTAQILRRVHEVGSTFLYNNWGLGLSGIIIERLSGMTLGNFMKTRFFKPLGMTRSTLEKHPDWENVAEPYLWSGDAEHPLHVVKPPFGTGEIMAGAMSAKSTTSDLLRFYQNFMQALEDQTIHNSTSTDGSPFKFAAKLVEPQVSLSGDSADPSKGSYALGWVRATLPAPMSHVITPNAGLKNDLLVGKGLTDAPEILYHFGSLIGYLGSSTLIPKTKSAIVVETNTLANSDAANWIGSLILETVLDAPEKNDYVQVAKEAAAIQAQGFPKMLKEMAAERKINLSSKPETEYIGKYYNEVGTYYLDVFQKQEGGALFVSRGGNRDAVDTVYPLEPYDVDVFSWAVDYAESCRRGLWPNPTADYWLFKFEAGEANSKIDRLIWHHNSDVPAGETFLRDTFGEKPLHAEL